MRFYIPVLVTELHNCYNCFNLVCDIDNEVEESPSSHSNDFISTLTEDRYVLCLKIHEEKSPLWERIPLTDKRGFLQQSWKAHPLSPPSTGQNHSFIENQDCNALEVKNTISIIQDIFLMFSLANILAEQGSSALKFTENSI